MNYLSQHCLHFPTLEHEEHREWAREQLETPENSASCDSCPHGFDGQPVKEIINIISVEQGHFVALTNVAKIAIQIAGNMGMRGRFR